MLCRHGAVDPLTTNIVSISDTAFELLQVYTPLPDFQVCVDCVEEKFALRVQKTSHAEQVGSARDTLMIGRAIRRVQGRRGLCPIETLARCVEKGSWRCTYFAFMQTQPTMG